VGAPTRKNKTIAGTLLLLLLPSHDNTPHATTPKQRTHLLTARMLFLLVAPSGQSNRPSTKYWELFLSARRVMDSGMGPSTCAAGVGFGECIGSGPRTVGCVLLITPLLLLLPRTSTAASSNCSTACALSRTPHPTPLPQSSRSPLTPHLLHHRQVLQVLVRLEQGVPRGQLHQDAAHRPEVAGERPAQTQDHLGGAVVAGGYLWGWVGGGEGSIDEQRALSMSRNYGLCRNNSCLPPQARTAHGPPHPAPRCAPLSCGTRPQTWRCQSRSPGCP